MNCPECQSEAIKPLRNISVSEKGELLCLCCDCRNKFWVPEKEVRVETVASQMQEENEIVEQKKNMILCRCLECGNIFHCKKNVFESGEGSCDSCGGYNLWSE